MTAKVVEIFKYRNRTCVIVTGVSLYSGLYHNGYASVKPSSGIPRYQKLIDRIDADELTYSGQLGKIYTESGIDPNLWFLGFDSAHYWNEQNPESKTHESVKKRTMQMVDEMLKARI